MEILGIGPGEFVLILIVLLVVVGPERLPGLARSAGQFLVRARNWLQTSPDAALVLRARAEIEAELASIKNSLMEVQVVRDEVMDAAKQFGDSVNSISPPKLDLNSLVNPPAEPTITTNGQVATISETPGLVLPDGTPATGIPLDQVSTLELPDGSSVPIQQPAEAQPTNGLSGLPHSSDTKPIATAATAPALGELESINVRLQAIMADMWALQQQLKQRGALDELWQPPSLEVQFPTPRTTPLGWEPTPPTLETAPPASTEIPVEPPLPVEPPEDPVVLAARKRLEELTPMRVAHHAPPVVEPAPDESAPEATVTLEADTPTEIAEPEAIAAGATTEIAEPEAFADGATTEIAEPEGLAAAATTEIVESEAIATGAPTEIIEPEAFAAGATTEIAELEAFAAGAPTEIAEPEAIAEQPVAKPRRRRAAVAEAAQEGGEANINGAPAPKTRKRRAPAADAVRSDETEPVTTEKAS